LSKWNGFKIGSTVGLSIGTRKAVRHKGMEN